MMHIAQDRRWPVGRDSQWTVPIAWRYPGRLVRTRIRSAYVHSSWSYVHAINEPSFSRMLKRSVSVVLASLRGLNVPKAYASPLRSLRPCWTAFLTILQDFLGKAETLDRREFLPDYNSFSAAC